MALCTSLFLFQAPWTLLFSPWWWRSRHLRGSRHKWQHSIPVLILPCVPLPCGLLLLYLQGGWRSGRGTEALCRAAAPGGGGERPEGPWAQRAATSKQLPQLQKSPFTGHQQTSPHTLGKKKHQRCGLVHLNMPTGQALPGNGWDRNCDFSGLRMKLPHKGAVLDWPPTYENALMQTLPFLWKEQLLFLLSAAPEALFPT